MPTRPQQAAGIRIDPIPSLPCAATIMPAATAAAAPPDEPPGVRSRSHGLRVMPKLESVAPKTHSSGTVVRPTTTAPARRNRRTISWSNSLGAADDAADADPHGLAADGDVVLDRDRHAGQRQREAVGALVDRVGLAQRGLATHDLEGADCGVALGDAGERGLGRGASGEVAGAHGGRNRSCGVGCDGWCGIRCGHRDKR